MKELESFHELGIKHETFVTFHVPLSTIPAMLLYSIICFHKKERPAQLVKVVCPPCCCTHESEATVLHIFISLFLLNVTDVLMTILHYVFKDNKGYCLLPPCSTFFPFFKR